MPDAINPVDLGRTMDVLGTAPEPDATKKPLDAATAQKLERAVDTFRRDTLNRVREWLDGRAPQVDPKEASKLLAGPALEVARAAEDFSNGLLHLAKAGAMLDPTVVPPATVESVRELSGKLKWISLGTSVPWVAKGKAASLIAKHLVNLETLGATYGPQLALKLERNLPSLREKHANTDWPGLITKLLGMRNYRVSDAQAETLGRAAEAASQDTLVVVERLIQCFKSGDHPQVLSLLKGIAQGALALYVGLEATVPHREVDGEIQNLIDAIPDPA